MGRKRKTPQQVSAARRKAAKSYWTELTPEQRSERNRNAWAGIPAAKRSRIAKARWARKKAEAPK